MCVCFFFGVTRKIKKCWIALWFCLVHIVMVIIDSTCMLPACPCMYFFHVYYLCRHWLKLLLHAGCSLAIRLCATVTCSGSSTGSRHATQTPSLGHLPSPAATTSTCHCAGFHLTAQQVRHDHYDVIVQRTDTCSAFVDRQQSALGTVGSHLWRQYFWAPTACR